MTATIDHTKLKTMDQYLRAYGPLLGKKAIESLAPLHVPGRDDIPDFSYVTEHNPTRTPKPAQEHVIAAAMKMLDVAGNGFIVGQMGTGKSEMGLLTIHEHGGRVAYRAVVVCPDHLISVWEEELKECLADIDVFRFENWKGILRFLDQSCETLRESEGERRSSPPKANPVAIGGGPRFEDGVFIDEPYLFEDKVEEIPASSGIVTRRIKRWNRPERPTWILLGQDQAKWCPEFYGVGEKHRGFDGREFDGRSTRRKAVGMKPMVDEKGSPVMGPNGVQKSEKVIDRVVICPSCGAMVRGAKGLPQEPEKLAKAQHACDGNYLVGVPNPDDHASHGKDRLPGGEEYAKKVGKVISLSGRNYKVVACKEKLWNYNRTPYRYPPATIMQRKLRGFFKYLAIDEIHQQKSDESARSMSVGKIMGISRHVLGLTGTVIGGYANHLYPLLVRMSPGSIREEGFEWGKDMPWSQRYGVVDRVVTTKQEAGTVVVGRRQTSMRKARKGKSESKEYVRPGVLPTLYGKHMMGNSVFITLSEMSDELPDMFEYIGGPVNKAPRLDDFLGSKATREEAEAQLEVAKEYHAREVAGWFPTACDMEDDLAEEYKRVEQKLTAANKDLLTKGSMKLLGTMLWTLLDYPDKPYGWLGEHEHRHTVGYYDKPRDFTPENWRGVVSPADLGADRVRTKEKRLVEICAKEKAEGRQAWVYVNMTAKRNLQPRLKRLLEEAGLKVCILTSAMAKPRDRKEWIDKNGPLYDVVISNPILVETGLTLFSKKETGGHNFCTLIFYQTGFNLFTLRQAAARSWRIGQPKECRVYYLYYRNTMQHRAMNLMSRKMAAAAALDGEFSTEGLIGMSGEGSAQMALARTLKDNIDDGDTLRSWSKVMRTKSRSQPKSPEPGDAIAKLIPRPFPKDLLDLMEADVQLAAQTMLDIQSEAAKPKADPVKPKPVTSPIEFDNFDEDDDDYFAVPVLSRESLAMLFANAARN